MAVGHVRMGAEGGMGGDETRFLASLGMTTR